MAADLQLAVRGTTRLLDLPDGARVVAGRTPQCDICLDDDAVSRRHCAFERVDGGLRVVDLESANGTFVNDRQIDTAAAVGPGDTVRLGGTVIEIRRRGAPAPSGTVLGDDAEEVAPVVSRQVPAAEFGWLQSAATVPGMDLSVLGRAARHLTTLQQVSESLAVARDLAGLSSATLQVILDVTGGDRAAIVLRRGAPGADAAEVAASEVRQGDRTFTVSRTLVADVIARGVSTFASDAVADARFAAGQSVVRQQVRSVMCVPLRTADEILGALYVDSVSLAGRFSEADLELLAAIGNQAGVALHRVRLMGELERLLLDTIRAIAATIDAKDGYTHRHSERVAMLATRLARALGWTAEAQETVQLSALLHDVGKIAVPDSILNKPGRLTEEEFEAMRKHPEHGARILENIQSASIQAVLPGVLHHHEKWDGTGYPGRLQGEEIPLLGRLLGIADFFDALTSTRSYRAAMPIDAVVSIIVAESGRHFDPQLAALVGRLHEAGTLLPDGWRA